MRNSIKSAARALLVAGLALLALAQVFAPVPALAAEGGSLRVVSRSEEPVSYTAYRIADSRGVPQDSQLDWDALAEAGLAGEQLPARGIGRGVSLVDAVSEAVARDAGGSVAAELAGYVKDDAMSVTLTTVPVGSAADEGAVAADDGWWLLVAEGRRPILAWVAGKPLSLGDKMDVPASLKEVLGADGTWGTVAFAGAGTVFDQRVTTVVPESLTGVYELTMHDAWEEGVEFVPDSVRVTIERDGQSIDATEFFSVATDERTLEVGTPDLAAAGAKIGDTLTFSYQMRGVAPTTGVAAVANRAWLSYPTLDGRGTTQATSTRTYAFCMEVTKVAKESGEPLAGAQFAVRNADGAWLQADGSFGAEATRLTVSSGADGKTDALPAMVPGSYELVEVVAPAGYRVASRAIPVAVAMTVSDDKITLEAKATGAEVTSVDSKAGVVSLRVADERAPLPTTGDAGLDAALYGGVAVAAVILVAVAVRLRRHA